MSNELSNPINIEQLLQVSGNLVAAYQGMDRKIDEVVHETKTLRDEVKELLRSTALSGHERRALQKAVKKVVVELCAENKWLKKNDSRNVFPVVWNALYERFDVTTYEDIAREDYKEALRIIRNMELSVAEKDRIDKKLQEV